MMTKNEVEELYRAWVIAGDQLAASEEAAMHDAIEEARASAQQDPGVMAAFEKMVSARKKYQAAMKELEADDDDKGTS